MLHFPPNFMEAVPVLLSYVQIFLDITVTVIVAVSN